METAVEIARSCNLIDYKKMIELNFVTTDFESLKSRLDNEIKYLQIKDLWKHHEDLAIIVDGLSLQMIFTDRKVTHDFFSLCRASSSVVCCRLSPKQKSDIVEHYI